MLTNVFLRLGNGSDVFGSDICTCKPYLTYAIEECIRGAQKGGVGVVAYFRKEGRALGEVTKYVPIVFLFRPSSLSTLLSLSLLLPLFIQIHASFFVHAADVSRSPDTSCTTSVSAEEIRRTNISSRRR